MLKFISDILTNPGILTAAAALLVAISAEKQKKEINKLNERLKKLESKIALNEIEQQIAEIEKK